MSYAFESDQIERVFGEDAKTVLKMIQRCRYEEAMREENPAVQDAWEKYQTVLRLAGDK